MQIERLQIDLHPRPHAQALDLGLALLHAHAGDVYRAWLAVWLPLTALVLALCWLVPGLAWLWMLLPWWLRPALDRVPLYVLSRAVFGERTAWRDALRAWPGQLRGGMFRMLTWWRPFMAGRGLYQPVWQLEAPSAELAARRRAVLGRNGTGQAAWLFGMACATLELVLFLGLIVLAGLFMPTNTEMHPLVLLLGGHDGTAVDRFSVVALALAAGVMAPVYVAGCFALYLNRRATLEAWDIELILRRLQAPAANGTRARRGTALLAIPLLALALAGALLPQPVQAAECTPAWQRQKPQRGPEQDGAQGKLRSEIDRIYRAPDLRGYRCEEQWTLRDPVKTPKDVPEPELPSFGVLALAFKWLLIGGAIALVAWLLYRYRDRLPALRRAAAPQRATEIGGLDIRPDSLPDDVPAAVRALWDGGQRRAALALLYRATLSRLVSDDGLHLYPGATEGDCLRLARQANAGGQLDGVRLRIADGVTALWLHAAYGDRWPDGSAVHELCGEWARHFTGKVAA